MLADISLASSASASPNASTKSSFQVLLNSIPTVIAISPKLTAGAAGPTGRTFVKKVRGDFKASQRVVPKVAGEKSVCGSSQAVWGGANFSRHPAQIQYPRRSVPWQAAQISPSHSVQMAIAGAASWWIQV